VVNEKGEGNFCKNTFESMGGGVNCCPKGFSKVVEVVFFFVF
jgi:hypothetical protein